MATDVIRLVESVKSALDTAGNCLPPGVEVSARNALDDAVRRYEQVGDHTVVALVGGTGSGKSSLFNALTGTDFADDGVLRPTTRRASSCSWGGGADALLDFLGVERGRRMTREPHPDEPDIAEGLVLLDLPDNDSVEEAHLHEVEQLLPVVDVLAWVVDPQKYADHLLHAQYLRVLRRRADAMVVIVNQIDTLTADGVATVVADVKSLLVEDGLPDVDVLTACALTGDGVDAIRQHLGGAAASQSTAQRTIEAEIAQIASRVLEHMGASEAQVDHDIVDEAINEFLAASGVEAVSDALREARSGDIAVRPQAPGRAAVAAIGSTWAARATEGLPTLWADAVEARLPSVPKLRESASAALTSVPVQAPNRGRARAFMIFGWLLAALTVVAAAVAVFGLIDPENGPSGGPGVVLAVGAAVLAVGAITLLRRARREEAQARVRAAEEYSSAVRSALRDEVLNVLVFPTAEVLTRHSNARASLEKAAG